MLDAMASAVLAFAVASVKVATGRNLVAFCCGCAYRRRTNRITLSVASAIIGLPFFMAAYSTPFGHPIHGHSTRRSERSDAGFLQLIRGCRTGQGFLYLADPEFLVFQPPVAAVPPSLPSAGYSLFRLDFPLSAMRWALCTSRSRMASASVGSPIASCQCSTGSWLVTRVECVA